MYITVVYPGSGNFILQNFCSLHHLEIQLDVPMPFKQFLKLKQPLLLWKINVNSI